LKARKNILLVEDDKDDQEFFIEALGEIEYPTLCDVANNGKEALDWLEKSDILPDLIFMDIHMPVMNGIECLSEIKKNPKIKNVPVVVLTTETGQIEITRELGAKAFIKKPGDIKMLREKIEQMINLDFIADSQVANQTFQHLFSASQTVR
jgi:CheY-like chemotaxis protein